MQTGMGEVSDICPYMRVHSEEALILNSGLKRQGGGTRVSFFISTNIRVCMCLCILSHPLVPSLHIIQPSHRDLSLSAHSCGKPPVVGPSRSRNSDVMDWILRVYIEENRG